MAYSGTLLKINGTTVSGLKEYSVQYAKLWKDSERNMAGNISATLIGIFPKIMLTFADGLTENQVSTISGLLSNAYFSATYFDPKTKATKTAQFYASDFDIKMLDKTRGLYQSFSVNLVPVSKE